MRLEIAIGRDCNWRLVLRGGEVWLCPPDSFVYLVCFFSSFQSIDLILKNVGKTTVIRKVLEGRLVAHIDFRKQGVIYDINQFIRILQDQFQYWTSTSRELSDSVNKLIGGTCLRLELIFFKEFLEFFFVLFLFSLVRLFQFLLFNYSLAGVSN
jgi:hypothetical protein